jgi:acyl carrier protein
MNAVNLTDIKEKMKLFIIDKFLMGEGFKEFDEDDSFLENGIIDSTGVLELVTFTEEEFGIHIDDEEMVPDNLDSVNNISRFIVEKVG